MSIGHVMSLALENLGNLNVRVPYLLVVYMPPAVTYSDLDFYRGKLSLIFIIKYVITTTCIKQ